MKCRNCAKVATLHITEIVKGVVQEHHLCEDCAKPFLENPHLGAKSAGVPAGPTTGGATSSGEAPVDEQDRLICPACELSFREFRNQGRLGCSHCYTAFQEELLPLLENIHGDTQHCGKYPKRVPEDNQRQFKLIKLRNELREAIAEESYEDAAKLRDQIQQLENQLSGDATR